MTTNRLSLAQQIAQLEEATPVDFDPEDVHIAEVHNDGDESILDLSLAREHYLDVGPSALRKLHDSIADPKYDGVRTSRKHLLEDSDEVDSEFDTGDVREEHGSRGTSERDAQEEDVTPVGQGEEESSEPELSGSKSGSSHLKHPPAEPEPEPEPVEDLSSTLLKTREDDLLKGKAVSRQIALWDTLLDARIRLQKSITAANRFPALSDISKYTTSADCRDSLSNMFEEAAALSDELFALQESLLISNESIQPPPRKKRRMQDGTTDHEAYFLEASEAASALENRLHPYILQTVSKWSSKIQAVTPSVLLPSNRNAFSKTASQHHLKSAVQLIDETLADHEKILRRTKVRRGKGVRVGAPDASNNGDGEEEVDVELFDDTDFYQQLLRDVIDTKGNAAGGGDDWVITQKQKKAKKKVDTKASKGRKLRYEVHEKLQNFMVPVPVQGAWHEAQVDELFASLLGKGFESGGVAVEEAEEKEQLDDSNYGSFKVFG